MSTRFLLCSLSFCLGLAQDITTDSCKLEYAHLNGSGPVDISESCKEKACITKCCPSKHILLTYVNKTTCVSSAVLENEFDLQNLDDYSAVEIYRNDIEENGAIKSDKRFKDFTILHNDRFVTNCTQALYDFREPMFKFYILENGNVVLGTLIPNQLLATYGTEIYCVDRHLKAGNGKLESTTPDILFYVDAEDENNHVPPASETRPVISAWAYLVSCVFLLLLLLVYALLPELRNLMGLMLMAYVATETVSFLLRTIHVFANYSDTLGPEGCTVMTLLVYYTRMSTFSWMNVMAFDIWWRIWRSLPYNERRRRKLPVTFIWYSLYAWGLTPLTPTLFIVIVDHLDLKDFTKPGVFDSPYCFFSETTYTLYVAVPQLVLITASLILFTMTAGKVWLIGKGVRRVCDSKSNTPQYSFKLYLRLSVVMGVSWIFDVLQEVIVKDSWVWYISDTYNSLVGLFLFVIFVCKKKIILMLCKKFSIDNEWVSYVRARGSTTATSRRRSTRSSDLAHNSDAVFDTPA